MIDRPQLSNGMFLYLVGLVVIATHPERFWLGFALAVIPVLIDPVGRLVGGDRWRRL